MAQLKSESSSQGESPCDWSGIEPAAASASRDCAIRFPWASQETYRALSPPWVTSCPRAPSAIRKIASATSTSSRERPARGEVARRVTSLLLRVEPLGGHGPGQAAQPQLQRA